MYNYGGWSGGIHEYMPADVETLTPVAMDPASPAVGTLIGNRSGAGEKNTVVTDTAVKADGNENYGGETTLYGKVLQGSTVTNNGNINLQYQPASITSVNGINTIWSVQDMGGDLVNNGTITISPDDSLLGGAEGGTQEIIGIHSNTKTTKNTGEIRVTNTTAVTASVTKGIRSDKWGATTTNEGKINVSGKTGTVNGIDSSNVINTDTGSI